MLRLTERAAAAGFFEALADRPRDDVLTGVAAFLAGVATLAGVAALTGEEARTGVAKRAEALLGVAGRRGDATAGAGAAFLATCFLVAFLAGAGAGLASLAGVAGSAALTGAFFFGAGFLFLEAFSALAGCSAAVSGSAALGCAALE